MFINLNLSTIGNENTVEENLDIKIKHIVSISKREDGSDVVVTLSTGESYFVKESKDQIQKLLQEKYDLKRAEKRELKIRAL